MKRRFRILSFASVGVTSLLLTFSQAQALTIAFNFLNGFAAGSDQRKVAEGAAQWWESAIQTDFTVNIDLGFAAIDGVNLAGRTHSNAETADKNLETGTKLPKSAAIDLNTNASFFFDRSEGDNSEFNMTMERGRFGNCNQAACQGKWDALSVITHELGHALGFIGTTGKWGPTVGDDGKPFTAFTDFANNFTNAASPHEYIFDFLTEGQEGKKGGGGATLGTVPFDEGHHHIDGTPTGNSALTRKLMAIPGFGFGQRSLPTPLDVEILADAFHIAIIPEPSTQVLVGIGLLGVLGYSRRRKKSG